jgi:hypothetical protein
MNRSPTSVSGRILSKIRKAGEDRLWTYADFEGEPETAVAATLSRLSKKGELSRVRKGIYYVPKATRFGSTVPDAPRVAEKILKARGVRFSRSGLAMYNRLGVTTQVSPVVTFVVDRDMRSFETGVPGRIRIRAAHNHAKLSNEERSALDALRDINLIPGSSPEDVIEGLAGLMKSGAISFARLAAASLSEKPRVRALLGLIGTIIGADEKRLAKLRESLNKTTKFKLGISSLFKESRLWAIL